MRIGATLIHVGASLKRVGAILILVGASLKRVGASLLRRCKLIRIGAILILFAAISPTLVDAICLKNNRPDSTRSENSVNTGRLSIRNP